MITTLVNGYGFEGFLAVASMDPTQNGLKRNAVEQIVAIPPKDVQLFKDQDNHP